MSKSTKPVGLISAAVQSRLSAAKKADADSTVTATKRKLPENEDIEIIDLASDEEPSRKATPPTKRPSVKNSSATPPPRIITKPRLESPQSPVDVTNLPTSPDYSQPVPTRIPTSPIEPTSPVYDTPISAITSYTITEDDGSVPEHGLPTPESTPQKSTSLKNAPQIHDRYVPKISLEEAVDFTNPRKFCLKPAYWESWSAKEYNRLAEEIRAQFDPLPFAKASGKPVEEVRHVFAAVVINPMYDAAEAKRRGKEGMEQIMETFSKGTPTRIWGTAKAKTVVGELTAVAKGAVQLALKDGSKKVLKTSEMSPADIGYLKATLTPEDERMVRESGSETGA